ncbi:MAG: NADH-quinone oxidoreductase subunit C [Planctomycetes bacterium]|nr:NADH-quinone oxidoreductase subunit C [Planctomycetota bacterium]
MDFNTIVERLIAKWPEVEAPKIENGDPFAVIPAKNTVEILRYLKNDPDLSFDSLMSIAGADSGRELWVVYPLHSFKHFHRFMVKVVLPRVNPEVESVSGLWQMADFFEREAYDLYGIHFKGHPDLRRIMNPPDWEGWPGRKDYEYPMDYQGIPTVRADQFFDDRISKEVGEREAKEKELVAKIEAEVKAKLATAGKPEEKK